MVPSSLLISTMHILHLTHTHPLPHVKNWEKRRGDREESSGQGGCAWARLAHGRCTSHVYVHIVRDRKDRHVGGQRWQDSSAGKAPGSKPYNLTSVPRIHMVERADILHCPMKLVITHKHTHTQVNVCVYACALKSKGDLTLCLM